MANITTIVGLVVIAVLLYKLVIYPAWLSPLAKVPNAHITAPLSRAWILWVRYMCKENATILQAHERHGPVVRLAPNELSVNCVEDGIRTIYTGGFEKHRYYEDLFVNYNNLNMFSSIHSKPHSIRKRMVSNVYSKSFIQTSATNAAVSRIVMYQQLLPLLRDAALKSKNIEMWSLMNSVTMDLVTGFMFGLSQGTKFLSDERTASWWLRVFQSRKKYMFWVGELPGFTNFVFNYMPFLLPKDVLEESEGLEQMILNMCDAADEVCTNPKEQRVEDVPIVYKQLKKAISTENSKEANSPYEGDISRLTTPRMSIASELLDNAAAGQETSAITMTYLFWELAKRPPLQERLRKELRGLSPAVDFPLQGDSKPDLPSPKAIDALPLLHAVLMETLRLRSAIPGSQPRITPVTSTGGTKLGKYEDIPPNVRVSASAFALHRNARVFPSPEKWEPDRWLEEKGVSGGQRAEMHRWFWAFGSGGRMCIGSNLAMQGIKLIITSVMTNFRITIVDDSGMVQEDGYVAKPIGEKLLMRFEVVTKQ